MIRLFVFDLDGTLVDSLRDLADSANEVLVSYGAAPLEIATIGGMVGDGAATLVARACVAAGIAPRDALARFLEIYDARLLTHTRPYEGMPDVIATLGRSASLAVLTNKPLGATRRILAGLDLAKFFDEDAVIGGDGPWPRKPDTAGLLHLCATCRGGAGRCDARRRLARRLADGPRCRHGDLSCALRFRLPRFSVRHAPGRRAFHRHAGRAAALTIP